MTNMNNIVKKDQFRKDVEQAEYWVTLISLISIACFAGFASATLILR